MKLKEFDFKAIPSKSPMAPGKDVKLVIDDGVDVWFLTGNFENIFDHIPVSYPNREIEKTYWLFDKFFIKLFRR